MEKRRDRRGAIMHLTDLVGDARVKQNAFGSRGLARINVRDDADIAITTQWVFSGHSLCPQ